MSIYGTAYFDELGERLEDIDEKYNQSRFGAQNLFDLLGKRMEMSSMQIQQLKNATSSINHKSGVFSYFLHAIEKHFEVLEQDLKTKEEHTQHAQKSLLPIIRSKPEREEKPPYDERNIMNTGRLKIQGSTRKGNSNQYTKFAQKRQTYKAKMEVYAKEVEGIDRGQALAMKNSLNDWISSEIKQLNSELENWNTLKGIIDDSDVIDKCLLYNVSEYKQQTKNTIEKKRENSNSTQSTPGPSNVIPQSQKLSKENFVQQEEFLPPTIDEDRPPTYSVSLGHHGNVQSVNNLIDSLIDFTVDHPTGGPTIPKIESRLAIVERLNAAFSGRATPHFKVDGEVVLSAPLSSLQHSYQNEEKIIFKIKNFENLENVRFHPQLFGANFTLTGDGNLSCSWSVLLKVLSEKRQTSMMSSDIRITIMVYEIKKGQLPLTIYSEWKCNPNSTHLDIHYKYNSNKFLVPLENVGVLTTLQGEAINQFSTPQAIWDERAQSLQWRLGNLPANSDGVLSAEWRVRHNSKPQKVFFKFTGNGQIFSDLNLITDEQSIINVHDTILRFDSESYYSE